MADEQNDLDLQEYESKSPRVIATSIKTQTDNDRNPVVTPTTRANLEPSATVKFVLLPMNQVVTFAYPLNMLIKDMKAQISVDLKMDNKHLQFYFQQNNDQTLLTDDSLRLVDLGVEPNGILQFKVSSIDQKLYPLKPYEPKEKYLSPDVITVHISLENNQYKQIVVEIERANIKKPFLGGFKNRATGKEFLNASSQTNKIIKPDNGVKKFCRDTQTTVSNHIKLQTRQDMSTQMTKPGVFISRIQDKLLTPRPYQTADEREAIIVKAVVVIQKYFRRWLAKKKFIRLKTAYEERVQWEKDKENDRIRDVETRRQNDINRRLNPRTKDDFEILYSALEKWRLEELTKINTTKSGAARKAALAMLVDQEAELIATIERYKIEANKENKEKNTIPS